MLRTRLIVGTILVALTAGMLFLDRYLAPWFPFLLVLAVALSFLATSEFLQLLPEQQRPDERNCFFVPMIVLSNWLPVLITTLHPEFSRVGMRHGLPDAWSFFTAL